MTSMDDASRDYTKRGWSIIPIKTKDKRPLIRWEDFQHRRPKEAEARAWVREWPECGIGIVTGLISGLVVIDVDAEHGGNASLEQLEREYGRLPRRARSEARNPATLQD
jgi:Bifunctional DNA primase/polymerase, N-terminal